MASNVINNNLFLKIGPRGNLDLEPSFTRWDEAGYGKVKQIFISYSADAINSIQMVYELNGTEVLADRHGGDGNCFESIRFAPGHYITSISGHFGWTSLNPSLVIKSLRFSTSSSSSGSKTYGPFGSEMGTPFRFDSNGIDSLSSFHGSSSSTHLTSIGVYMAVPNVKHFFKKSSSDQSGELPALCSIPRKTNPGFGSPSF